MLPYATFILEKYFKSYYAHVPIDRVFKYDAVGLKKFTPTIRLKN